MKIPDTVVSAHIKPPVCPTIRKEMHNQNKVKTLKINSETKWQVNNRVRRENSQTG
jgi:hypothetical protein